MVLYSPFLNTMRPEFSFQKGFASLFYEFYCREVLIQKYNFSLLLSSSFYVYIFNWSIKDSNKRVLTILVWSQLVLF